MEYGVNTVGRRQVQFISHLTDMLQYMKWPEELEGQLMVLATSNGLLDVWLQTKEHLVTHRKIAPSPVLILLGFHALLHPQEVLLC
jgi:hypothetical protein